MGQATTIARTLQAAHTLADGQPRRLTALRHVRVSPVPLVLLPLSMAGENGTVLGVVAGTGAGAPRVFTPVEPRSRQLFWDMLDELAQLIVSALEPTLDNALSDAWSGHPPQLLTAAPGSVEAITVLARRMMYGRSFAGSEPAEHIVRAGRLLTWFVQAHELRPSLDLVLVATEQLARHWAVPLSPVEQQHLGAVLATVDPPPGVRLLDTVREAEAKPGAAQTMPADDRRTYLPIIERFNAARGDRYAPPDPALYRRFQAEMAAALRHDLVDVLWRQVWRTHALLSSLDPLPAVADGGDRTRRVRDVVRWEARRWAARHNHFAIYESPMVAVGMLANAEREQEHVAVEELDDPVVARLAMLEGRLVQGMVIGVDRTRHVSPDRPGGRRKFRPTVTVTVPVGWIPAVTDLYCAAQKLTARVLKGPGDGTMTLEINGGMGRSAASASEGMRTLRRGVEVMFGPKAPGFYGHKPRPAGLPLTHTNESPGNKGIDESGPTFEGETTNPSGGQDA